MNLPTERQWARYSALCARLRPLPPTARAAALQGLRAAGDGGPASALAGGRALRPAA